MSQRTLAHPLLCCKLSEGKCVSPRVAVNCHLWFPLPITGQQYPEHTLGGSHAFAKQMAGPLGSQHSRILSPHSRQSVGQGKELSGSFSNQSVKIMTIMTGATKVSAPCRKPCNRRLADNLCAAAGLASTPSSISWAATVARRCTGQLFRTTSRNGQSLRHPCGTGVDPIQHQLPVTRSGQATG